MYKDGWWLSWMRPRIPWKIDPETLKRFAPGVWDPERDPVERYYLPDDFTQAKNLAGGVLFAVDITRSRVWCIWTEASEVDLPPTKSAGNSATG